MQGLLQHQMVRDVRTGLLQGSPILLLGQETQGVGVHVRPHHVHLKREGLDPLKRSNEDALLWELPANPKLQHLQDGGVWKHLHLGGLICRLRTASDFPNDVFRCHRLLRVRRPLAPVQVRHPGLLGLLLLLLGFVLTNAPDIVVCIILHLLVWQLLLLPLLQVKVRCQGRVSGNLVQNIRVLLYACTFPLDAPVIVRILLLVVNDVDI
mmetsp:Transcript_12920/g.30725  ORF Transcript_12920/g.30725 Transcript_12920/m.30725 type:complete len:209 (+) Transcript_12920:88-714(+)